MNAPDPEKVIEKVIDLVFKEKGDDVIIFHQVVTDAKFPGLCEEIRESQYVDVVKFCKKLKTQDIDPNKYGVVALQEIAEVKPIDEIKELLKYVLITPLLMLNKDAAREIVKILVTPTEGDEVIIVPPYLTEKLYVVLELSGLRDALQPRISRMGAFDVVRVKTPSKEVPKYVKMLDPFGLSVMLIPVDQLGPLVSILTEVYSASINETVKYLTKTMKTLDEVLQEELAKELK